MTKNKPIFGLRFGSNDELSPTREELRAFLQGPKIKSGRETHDSDLKAYREQLEGVTAFEQHQRQYTAPRDLREKMFYGVLGHSRFFNPVLASAVEQYKYHAHALMTLDFKKPTAFIKAAEEELSGLNPKKKDDAIKLDRLGALVDERKKTLETLGKRRAALVKELEHIALYLRDNLVMIEKLCEASIAVLVDLHLSRKKEGQLIEDVKTHFKEHLRDSLRDGRVDRQYVETVKEDVAQLSKEISSMLREDTYALTRLYEAVHDHAQKAARELDTLVAKSGRGKDQGIDDERALFTKVEKVLVSLVSEYRFDLKPAIIRSETAHENILLEKRRELIDHVFELLQK